MTFLHSIIIALMNGCKVAAGRQKVVCGVVWCGVRGKYKEDRGKRGEGRGGE